MTKLFLTLILLLLVLPGIAIAQVRAAVLSSFSAQQGLEDKRLKESVASERKESEVDEIRFEGLHSIDVSDMLFAFRERRIGDAKQIDFDSAKVQDAVLVIKELLADRGYFHASVRFREDQISDTAKAITFIVSEGERTSITELRFEGNKNFPTQQLHDQVEQCITGYTAGGYNSRVIDECLRRLAYFMRSQGYLQSTTGKPELESNERGFQVTIPVVEGIRYRIGEVRIEGSKLFSPAQIMEVLDLNSGDVANGEKIGEALFDRLKKLYADKGYIQYTAEPEPTFRESSGEGLDGVVDFNISIDEGQQFVVRTIRFKDSESAADQELRSALLLSEGDIYSEQLFYDSIKALNQLGLFNGNRERDIDILTNAEKPELDIVIHLKPRVNQPLKRKAATASEGAELVYE
ncbi:MAG TPA: POTRA domain-containing protein [Pyrinomonadaceae bacterium]|jgi:outer membrane protein insertion porin family|nr:POTRA domain-containing protein [Pyrinomonadaceae bacterium]